MQSTIMNKPQVDLLFDHLVSLKSITPMEAQELYNVRSFHRRMADLRDMGVRFTKERKKDHTGRAYVKYHFAGVAL
jgi:hypothetical protein